MTRDLVQDSWNRIDEWLREHAPRTFATLGPPAGHEEIAAAQEELGVTFPPDLIASLLRHDGAVDGAEAFLFSTHDRLLGVAGIIEDTTFMRCLAEDLDEEEAESYWHHGYVKFGSYGVTSDGLMVDCRPGRDSFGAVGRFFDETGTDFGRADSLGEYLAELADQLERGQDGGAVTFNGRLFWELASPAGPEWGSADDPLPAPDEQLPELDLSCSPTDLLHVSRLDEFEELGALIAVLPRERVADAARKQLRRLAVETGLEKYPEVRSALDAWERGETPPRPQQTDPLALRLRKVLAQADTHRDNLRKRAAEEVVHGIWGSPHKSVCGIAGTRSRLTADWRADLHADLGNPPLPSIPDERFWGALRNPAVDSSWWAAQYAQDQG
ncbi:SMI1/KNR4 family protein [Streptomyces sp. MJP52]|uniref:SMI1/KNR4 family protein n=1 Tax=Streptomyces sp. MJP52 TaxID=2940555 RepID=UPI0024759ABC|nr:SMI1/KNR4 family protein [Streptomyces sp. MJP52]MDH6229016.1 cell wall assembly regulator SMI1 [Streptomyces sp. MJP52]